MVFTQRPKTSQKRARVRELITPPLPPPGGGTNFFIYFWQKHDFLGKSLKTDTTEEGISVCPLGVGGGAFGSSLGISSLVVLGRKPPAPCSLHVDVSRTQFAFKFRSFQQELSWSSQLLWTNKFCANSPGLAFSQVPISHGVSFDHHQKNKCLEKWRNGHSGIETIFSSNMSWKCAKNLSLWTYQLI